MEVWAAIDLLGGRAVTLVQGDASKRTIWKEAPLELAARWENEGAQGLHVVDLDGAFQSGSNSEVVERIVRQSRTRVQVGGGVRSEAMVERLLEMGADRVVLGTLAYKGPATLSSLLRRHGPEKIVVAADYREGRIAVGGWRESETLTVLEAVARFDDMGVKNILATAVGLDGMGSGPDFETVKKICVSTGTRILASGGIRSRQDVEGLGRAGAYGVVLGKALYEGTIRLRELST